MFKKIAKYMFKGNFNFGKVGGTLGNFESGGTLEKLLGGTVGAHPGEPLGASTIAPPLYIE